MTNTINNTTTANQDVNEDGFTAEEVDDANFHGEWEKENEGAVITREGWEWVDFTEISKRFGDKIVNICPEWIGRGFSEQTFDVVVFDATSEIDADGFQTVIKRFHVTTPEQTCNKQWNDVVEQVDAQFA
jgi:hypothetical protein